VLEAFKPFQATLTAQEGALGLFNDVRGQAEKLSAKYVIGGMTSQDAAAKAFDDLIGFKYVFQDGYRIPKDPNIDPAEVRLGAVAVKNALGEGNRFAPARDDMGGLRAEYLTTGKLDAIKRDGKWVTSPDERGLVLAWNDRPVRLANGQPLIVPWRELMQRGQDLLTPSANPMVRPPLPMSGPL
jgi:peptidoglycan lytic transglycosylase